MSKIAFKCRSEDCDPDDAKEILDYNPEDAAEQFAEWWDSQCSEYPDSQVVIVVSPNGIEDRVIVTADYSRNYYATKET